jgi:anti-sigma factor ChrR (cupin superfamily)
MTPIMEAGHGSVEFAESLTLYAFDLLDAGESQQIEEHLARCASCATEVAALRETAADVPYALPDVHPHPRVREKLLKSVQASRKASLEQPLPGMFVMREEQQRWIKSPFEGVDYKILYVDRATKNVTSLLRLQPGAQYPAHRHAAVEQCLVLEGTVRLGAIRLERGDFEYAVTGTEHAFVRSDTGCVLMIISNQHDEIFA